MFFESYTDARYKSLEFSVMGMFKFGWYLVKENFAPLMIVTILMSLPTNIMANALFLNDIIPVRDGIN